MTCPVCNGSNFAYLTCNRPDCTDGRHAGAGVSGTVPPDEQKRREQHEALVSSHAARGKEIEHKANLIRMKDRDRAKLARMLKAWLEAADPVGHAALIDRTKAVLHMNARGLT